MLFVTICQCLRETRNVRGSLFFREVARLTQLPVELTTESILQYEKDALVIMEPAIKPQNVGMAKAKLNVHFSLQLVMQSVLFYLLFEYHLQRHHILALDFTGKVDAPEFALAEGLSNFEIVD